MAKSKGPQQRSEITTEFEGRTYRAGYHLEGVVVCVDSVYGSNTTQAGGSPPHAIAHILLNEILKEAKKRGELI